VGKDQGAVKIVKLTEAHILPERNKGNAHEMSKIHVESVLVNFKNSFSDGLEDTD